MDRVHIVIGVHIGANDDFLDRNLFYPLAEVVVICACYICSIVPVSGVVRAPVKGKTEESIYRCVPISLKGQLFCVGTIVRLNAKIFDFLKVRVKKVLSHYALREVNRLSIKGTI